MSRHDLRCTPGIPAGWVFRKQVTDDPAGCYTRGIPDVSTLSLCCANGLGRPCGELFELAPLRFSGEARNSMRTIFFQPSLSRMRVKSFNSPSQGIALKSSLA